MSKNKLYLVDFDRTLFNTDEFVDDLISELENQGHLSEDAREVLTADLRSPDTVDFMTHIGSLSLTLVELEEAADQLPRNYLYEDAEGFLDSHPSTIVVTTAANDEFQKLKVQISEVDTLVPCFITPNNKGEVLRDIFETDLIDDFVANNFDEPPEYDGIVLIDDRYTQIEPLLERPEIEAIQIVRNDSKYPPSSEQGSKVKQIKTLKEIK